MPHPLVRQLRFTRGEFKRGLRGLKDEDARRRFLPMNCISWNVGHLAWQEQRYWLKAGMDQMPFPEINKSFAFGAPPSTPPLDEMWQAWTQITKAADPWLNQLTTEKLLEPQARRDGGTFTFGNLLQRVIYHYWFHTGENMAIRQNLGHKRLPQFVGNIDGEAPFRAT